MSAEIPLVEGDRAVVLGLGVTGTSLVRALVARNIGVSAVDDNPSPQARAHLAELDVEIIDAPDELELRAIFDGAAAFLPSPGIPESHIAFSVAERSGMRTISEFDLARWWDDRPIAAVTGTDGKTSVTLLTVAMLEASGVATAAVGNTEVPLIDAIDDPSFDVFVVEASSFRLAHTERFEPSAAAWLNFSPDHLDVHASLAGYERAKSRIFEHLRPDGVAVVPVDDPVVLAHSPADRHTVKVGLDADSGANAFVEDGRLILEGVDIAGVEDLERSFPHDITNTLVGAALATHLGATIPGIRTALATHRLPPHRIQFVGESEGISFYNDSKATVPHAVITAVRSFDSVVLIAGGRNKGLDMGPLRSAADRTRAVVVMGDAADEIVEAVQGATPVHRASGMDEAVRIARSLAEVGDAVVLSPGCTSFDAYANYEARGDDFIRVVQELVEVS